MRFWDAVILFIYFIFIHILFFVFFSYPVFIWLTPMCSCSDFPEQRWSNRDVPESNSSNQRFNLKRWTVSANETASQFSMDCLFIPSLRLGQRFDIFSSPSPRFIISINHCCSSNRVPASVILWESALSSIIYLL